MDGLAAALEDVDELDVDELVELPEPFEELLPEVEGELLGEDPSPDDAPLVVVDVVVDDPDEPRESVR